MKINENEWKWMKMKENEWRMKMYENESFEFAGQGESIFDK